MGGSAEIVVLHAAVDAFQDYTVGNALVWFLHLHAGRNRNLEAAIDGRHRTRQATETLKLYQFESQNLYLRGSAEIVILHAGVDDCHRGR